MALTQESTSDFYGAKTTKIAEKHEIGELRSRETGQQSNIEDLSSGVDGFLANITDAIGNYNVTSDNTAVKGVCAYPVKNIPSVEISAGPDVLGLIQLQNTAITRVDPISARRCGETNLDTVHETSGSGSCDTELQAATQEHGQTRHSTRKRRSEQVLRKKKARRSCPNDPLEACLRFHLIQKEEEEEEVSKPHPVKSVRVRKTTTVEDILPTLREKFQLSRSHLELKVYRVSDFGETELSLNDRPLEVLLKAEHTPRFVVRTTTALTPRDEMNLGPAQSAGYEEAQIHRRRSLGYPTLVRLASTNLEQTSIKHEQGDAGIPQGLDLSQQSSRTPDLVGDCRRKSINPPIDHRSSDQSLSSWSRSGSKSAMAASDSKLDAILDTLSDSNASIHDGAISDTGRGRNKSAVGKSKRRRSRSREASVESADRDFKPSSKRGSSLRSSKSMSNLFQKTFSLRKKDNPYRPRTELSTEETSPGVLKIFGDSISPGANYKSVLAVATSTAKELVKEALERYGISRKKSGMYVMCDVIGHFMNYSSDTGESDQLYSLSPDHGLWTEECIRIIGDNERPLILQKYWKPTEGYARRFELRRRSDLMVIEDADTSGVNANARRMLTSKSKTDLNVKTLEIAKDRKTDKDVMDDAVVGNGYASPSPARPLRHRNDEPLLDERRTERPVNRMKAPASCPYLLNVVGYDVNQDCVLYPITNRCLKVGNNKAYSIGKNVYLTAPDILENHCEFQLSAKSDASISEKTQKRSFSFHVEILPQEGATVTVNGNGLTIACKLNNGDTICLGKHYVFVYRDPYAQSGAQSVNTATHLSEVRNSASSTVIAQDTLQIVVPPTKSAETDDATKQWRMRKNQEYENDTRRLKLAYNLEKEDELLQTIVQHADEQRDRFRLSPAYLFAMMVEYSAAKHDQLCTRALLLKMATKIHNSVLRRARGLAEKQASMSNDGQPSTDCLLSDLCPVIQWMTNALELLHHFRSNMSDYLMDPELSLSIRSRASIATAGDEVLGTLEEVVMYTFQQTVYYLTKALYTCLPALMESNPFHDDSLPDSANGRLSTDHVLTVFQITLEYMRDYKLHPKVISQLFCYLFFFTSTSVFNSLMSKGSSEKYFRWSRGVQLRGNLDSLEAWAIRNDLNSEAMEYLKKTTCLVNLLATPKVQLLRSTWATLRNSFSELSPAQLRHVLVHYEDGRHQHLSSWQPTPEDIPALKTDDLSESFNNHPPLVFPIKGYFLDLAFDIRDPDFHKMLREMSKRFSSNEGHLIDRYSHSSEIITPVSNGIDNTSDIPKFERPTSRMDTSELSSPTPPPSWQQHQRGSTTLEARSSRTHSITSDGSEAASSFSGRRLDSGYMSMNRKSVPPTDTNWSLREDQKVNHENSGGRRSNYDTDSHGSPDTLCESHNVNTNKRSQHISPTGEETLSFRPISEPTDPTIEYIARDYVQHSLSPVQPHSEPHNGQVLHDRTNHFNSQEPVGEQLYMNIPYRGKRSDPGSLNSSISSQTSRDGREVYHYMRNILDRQKQIPPQPKKAAPVLTTADNNNLPAAKTWGECGVDVGKEIFVDDIISTQNETNLHVLPLLNGQHQTHENHGTEQGRTLGGGSSPAMSSSSLLDTIHNKRRKVIGHVQEEEVLKKDMFVVDLIKGPMGFGLGLIDGLHTTLRRPGIYIRTLVEGSPAQLANRLRLGDRILAVNGSSVIGANYASAMQEIKAAGELVQLTVTRSDPTVVMHITASPC